MSDSFPPEVIREILLKATVKSLLRCKSVCKEWYTLISDKHFIKSHYTLSSSTNNINYHRLLFNSYEQRNNLISCPLYDVLFNKSVSNSVHLENPLQLTPYRGIKIVGSCNGLVCIHEEMKDTLFIYNPATRRSNLFYNPASRRSNLLPCSQQIGRSVVRYHGFGYDELSSDYKVVIIRTEPKMATIIYSLKTGTWKEIGQFPCARPKDNGKLVNGALHWLAGKITSSDSWKIVSLDLAKETYSEILQPEYRKGSNCLKLGVSGEWLCVLHDCYESWVVDVWVMKVYGVKDSWTKLASVPYPRIRWAQTFDPLGPFCISEDGKMLLQFGPQLLVYDSKDGSSSMIKIECNNACVAVESLVSPFPPLGLADNNDDEN